MALRDGLVGAWCPSLGPTASTLLDRSGRNNHGTLVNMDQSTDWVQSGGYGALDFDGTNDYVGLSRQANFSRLCNDSSTMTVAFWVYPRSTSRNAFVADWDSAGSNESVRIEMSGFNVTSGRIGGNVLSPANSATIQTTATVTLNQWHHIVVMRTATGQRLFWNGVLNAENTVSILTSSTANAPAIARAGQFNGLYANCIMDDIAVWSRAITSSEVSQLYQQGRGRWLRLQRRRELGYVASTGARRRRILCGDYN